ncbi:L-fucose:H+ symporter permease [Pedobacter frigidisoli]|uniref:L-fucose:H+ symporter permease n=1 Tax=Pedobacter frigidisoli TaxID=2530455 RepID=UPI00292D0337|nr:L-fucose:H+ symporter permease [Pedobacter frigidisoli]
MKNHTFAIVLITSLFFLWGFAHNLDPILIPHLKRSFTLSMTQATLVDSAVFIAYFLMAIPAGMIMKTLGYKTGIVSGLVVFAVGCYLFIPAANVQSYSFFLAALFVIACGLTILETAANPYITALGPPESSAFRLNLAQSFNGLATSAAPILGAKFILLKGVTEKELSHMPQSLRKITLAAEASSVKIPYLILVSLLLVIALIFLFTRLPEIAKGNSGHKNTGKNIFQTLRHQQLSWAVTAQFFYVGAQVSVFSLFILYATKSAGITESQAANYLGICGLAFLIGRFFSTYLMRYFQPELLLWVYAGFNIFLCLIAIIATGPITLYSVIGICFFISIMFPTIFAIGIHELGEDTEYGSSLLIMSIVGGAVIPRIFGYISDETSNIQFGYIVPLFCFCIICVFGYSRHRLKNKLTK